MLTYDSTSSVLIRLRPLTNRSGLGVSGMYDLKGKENQNKKISDFEYLNYFEYVSHCLISTDLLCYLPDFKAEKKV